ncbi:type II toxin-antitoxin system RelE/ParE family toxin [Leclercia adecarboxylata]|uniref:Type II toxin-antitoxin system RelE/ParE family toxin n=1 Tax=Leclercia barmai TaxID=2785629 RepID=A0ABS7RSI2_9ENTR|nr:MULTISPECIES: type II toxin-antitoxin system RelE/ParE family toxin [Enterobacteriaceae]MBZ0057271.1 type II toxin-antitoxin system RelE/ParE family toxin [Leclercia sp. EMC7]MCM5695441.1 type II toxin-antitoxin system RelE/ParE family toxin [Leclercia sp. LTM01]MCM5699848.1 type II toxin-antitoxin system RelE/ParE family toxin [Leclercia sp. LTM14]QCZ29218.1 type II toxin-antitoxin system RelE/ParE family toxin [Leclercia adecarboxylata]TLU69925.1 type II toxin-antitoxin system RelE/ParE f
MCAEKTDREIEVYQSSRFEKVFKRLTKEEQDSVDVEIEHIIENPEIGEKKKGDLSYLWVHKFYMGKQQYLLGYTWLEHKLVIYLLSLGTHENYYDEQKRHRKADLKLLG